MYRLTDIDALTRFELVSFQEYGTVSARPFFFIYSFGFHIDKYFLENDFFTEQLGNLTLVFPEMVTQHIVDIIGKGNFFSCDNRNNL